MSCGGVYTRTRVGEHTADEDYDLLRSTTDSLARRDLSRLPRRGFDDGRPKQRDCRDSCGGLALHDLVDF